MKSYKVERNFGLIVGGVFTLLSVWWLYRGKFVSVASWTVTLGLALIVFGLIFPKALVYPNRAWMALAEVLAFISTRIILGLVFFLIVTPIGVAKRLLGWDPLNRRAVPRPSYWNAYGERQRDPRHYEKMF
jgi:hypothetical protein